MKPRLTIVLTVIALTLAACGGEGGNGDTTTTPTTSAGGNPVEVTIRMSEFSFNPDRIEVPANTPVTIIVINDGVVEHDFSIDAVDLHLLANPGETLRETVTFPVGTYDVHCVVPGHHEAGMQAVLFAR